MLTKIKNFRDKIFLAMLFSLFIISACYNLFFLENSRPGNLLREAAEHMETNCNNLEINIQEKGLGYSLNFNGKKMGQEFLGNFFDYNLQVYKNSAGSIFVKDLKDGIWKEAEEVGLETLQNFFVSPFELLHNYSSFFKKSKFIHNTGKERIISLDTPALPITVKDFYPRGFPPESLNIEFIISIEEDNPFIRELAISLYDKDSLKKVLSRNFSFKS